MRINSNLSAMTVNKLVLISCLFLQARKTNCLSAGGWLLDELPASPPPPRCSLFYRRQEKTNCIIPPLAPAKRLHRGDFEEGWDVADGLDLKLKKKKHRGDHIGAGGFRVNPVMSSDVCGCNPGSLLVFDQQASRILLFPPRRVTVISLAIISSHVLNMEPSIIFRMVLLTGDAAKGFNLKVRQKSNVRLESESRSEDYSCHSHHFPVTPGSLKL